MSRKHLNWFYQLAAGTALLVSTMLQAQAPAIGPDPREIPLPPIKTSLGMMPGVDRLPARAELPDILTMNDGTKVKTPVQWAKRREEMKKILEYYATGVIPPAPSNIQGTEVHSELLLDGKVKYRLVNFRLDQIASWSFTSASGPRPTSRDRSPQSSRRARSLPAALLCRRAVRGRTRARVRMS